MEKYKFYSHLKLSKFRAGLLIMNTFLSVIYIQQGNYNWALYLLLVIALFELIHVVDVLFKQSYIALEGDTLTISKWLYRKKTFNLSEYDQFRGRQRNGVIGSLVAYNINNPKLYIFILNVYKRPLSEFFQLVDKTPTPGEVVDTITQEEE